MFWWQAVNISALFTCTAEFGALVGRSIADYLCKWVCAGRRAMSTALL
jgi:hypothetical protein